MPTTITINLPIPPSVNELWRVRGGQPKCTERYKIWQQAAHGHFLEQGGHRLPKIKGHFTLSAVFDEKRRGNSDLDNRMKALLDYLQKGAGVIENDRLCDRISIAWGDAPMGCAVTLQGVPS